MWSGSNRARATRSQAMGRKPTHPIRYDCCLSQAGFLAYPVQLTEPPNKLTSWSELFSNLGATARDSEACRGAVQIVRIHLPPADSLVSRRNSPVTVEKPRFSASVAGRSSQRGRQRRA